MRWLTRLLLDPADLRAAESELAELHEYRRAHDGAAAADRWLRRQRRVYPWLLLADRVRSAAPTRNTMPHILRDLRYSLRTLARARVLSATIVLTIGLGLGATAAMIGVVRAVLVNPLPYAEPASLVWIYTDNPPYRFSLSVVDYRALEADHPALTAVAAYQTNQATVTDGGAAERVTTKAVTSSYFGLLGQRPHIGRLFDDGDGRSSERLAVLTHEYWTTHYGASPAVLGRTVALDGLPHTIVGVLERTGGPLERRVAMFTAERWPQPTRKGPFRTTVLGRLRPDVSPVEAGATLRATNSRLFPIWQSSYQDRNATWGLMDLKSRIVGDVGSRLYVVLAAVACVLLIAGANAANLLIARGLQRGRELAIRGALGASRLRLLQHVMTEAAVLSAGAAAVGLAVALIALRLVAAYGAAYLPRLDEVQPSVSLGMWLLALASGTTLLLGIVPAVHAMTASVDGALRGGGRSSTGGPRARRVRRVLVAAEFALATPLLLAAVLVLASLDRLSRVPVGIDTDRVITGGVSLPRARYADDTARAAFWKRMQLRLEALPGVDAVALADSRPPAESGNRNNFNLEDRPVPPGRNQPVCTWVGVSPSFFEAVGLRLVRGRLLDGHSLTDNVVVVDRAWQERFYPGEDALGRRFRNGGCTSCEWTTVVGVVENVKWTGLEAVADGTVYYPFVDMSDGFAILRTSADPAMLARPLQQAVNELDPELPVSTVATGDELVADALSTPRYLTVLIGIFAAAAVVLSVVGIYGVMTYFVQQQTREIGIRLALGGHPALVRRLIVFEGLRLVVFGVAVGLIAAAVLGRYLTTLLFGISAADPRAAAIVPAVLVAIALAACLLPARRAAAIDPAHVLRES